jgi:hypothetical protein
MDTSGRASLAGFHGRGAIAVMKSGYTPTSFRLP